MNGIHYLFSEIFEISRGPWGERTYFVEETCNSTCPTKCSSSNWKVYDGDNKNWIMNNILNIDCGNME